MLNRKKSFLFFLLGAVLMSGCAQKVRIKALQPAQAKAVSSVKKLAVLEFKNDRVGLSNKVEAKLFTYKIDAKPYFQIVSRKELSNVLGEQRLQNSGLIQNSSVVEAGNLTGADALLAGEVEGPSVQNTRFYTTRTKCNKDKCWEVKVACVERVVSVNAQMKLISTQKAQLLFADSLSQSNRQTHCIDESSSFYPTSMVAQELASQIADTFVLKLVPHYGYFSVTLLDEPDIEYSDAQEELLKNALAFIKQDRLDKAQTLLIKLIDSTKERSYVPLYNLGVIKEAEGDLAEAKKLYDQADSLAQKPVDELSNAVNRINDSIAKRQEVQIQMKER